ncbi:MAG: hypothetical protein K2Q01_07515, partial [Rickettsiales bacterium]|nr:hypothetical protein [Rickettsiales bacterium]
MSNEEGKAKAAGEPEKTGGGSAVFPESSILAGDVASGKVSIIAVEKPDMVAQVHSILGAAKDKIKVVVPDQIKSLSFEEKILVMEGIGRAINIDRRKRGDQSWNRNPTNEHISQWRNLLMQTFSG